MTGSEADDVDEPEVSLDLPDDVVVVEGRLKTDDVDGFLDELGEIGGRHDVAVQAFNARYVASPRHLRHAVAKARRAFERGEEVADTLAMETMLYVAGTRQISVATETGVRAGGCDAAVVLTPEMDGDLDRVPEAAVEEVEALLSPGEVDYLDREVATEFFDVSDEELAAVGDHKLELLVLERVALLDVDK